METKHNSQDLPSARRSMTLLCVRTVLHYVAQKMLRSPAGGELSPESASL